MEIKCPLLAVDAIVFNDKGELLLIRRKNPPFQNAYALPGGFVDVGESCDSAVARELREETNLIAKTVRLVGVYSDPARDPRRHVVSVAYLVTADAEGLKAGDDAASAHFIANWKNESFAFDHAKIIADAAKLRG